MTAQRYVGSVLVVITLGAVFAVAGVNVAALAPIAIILLVCALTMVMIRDMHRGAATRSTTRPTPGPAERTADERPQRPLGSARRCRARALLRRSRVGGVGFVRPPR